MSTSPAFDDIIAALHGAIIEAQRLTEKQYDGFLDRYFVRKEGSTAMQAVTVDIAVHSLRPGAPVDAKDIIQVPLICLAAPSAIKINELSVEFETELSAVGPTTSPLSTPAAAGAAPARHMFIDDPVGGDTHKSTTAKVTISFKGTDPPEGVLRINDIMLRRLP